MRHEVRPVGAAELEDAKALDHLPAARLLHALGIAKAVLRNNGDRVELARVLLGRQAGQTAPLALQPLLAEEPLEGCILSKALGPASGRRDQCGGGILRRIGGDDVRWLGPVTEGTIRGGGGGAHCV